MTFSVSVTLSFQLYLSAQFFLKDYQDHIEEIVNTLVSIAENNLKGLLTKVRITII